MDYALTMLVLWGLLFVPVGLAIHGLVLGESARVRALPLAPITGIAAALVVLAVLARCGVNAGDAWVVWAFAGASLASMLAIWRWKVAWRSRELLGVGGLLVLAIFLVQLPVIGSSGDGPLGYGTAANPVEEVAAIDAAVGGAQARQDIAREAAGSADERPVAFEQFAALTVSLGYDEADTSETSWTAYSLHAPLTGMLAALVALPLFAFARARGVRWLGLAFLVPVGVLAPYTFLALANGSGAAVATVPLFASAAFSLLTTRRDRGWWSLTMLFGSAMAVTAGALAILPLLTVGLVWIFLRATTYEHLAQADAPVNRVRALVPGMLGIGLAVVGIASTLGSGALLAWPRLHDNFLDALRSWPFAWLDTDLSTAGPSGGVETAVWLAGPVLLFVALVHGIIRNERRELAVLFGALAAAIVGLFVTTLDRAAGIRIYEYTILVTSPLLAALAVRGVALAREHAESTTDRGRIARIAGWGPAVLIVGFVLVSVAATAVVGTRMVHAPKLDAATIDRGEAAETIVAGGDQWLAFVVEGARVPGGYADPDALASKASNADGGFPLGRWGTLVASNSPLGSNPPARYFEDPALDSYQARLFYDRLAHPGYAASASSLDLERAAQRAYRPAADIAEQTRIGKSTAQQDDDKAASDADAAADGPQFATPLRHDPVEGALVRTRPDQPAGLLVPETDVAGCSDSSKDLKADTPCNPSEPIAGSKCTGSDVDAASSPLERRAKATAVPTPAPKGTQIVSLNPDPQQRPDAPLIGVQCFDVEIAPTARVLSLRIRNVGLILSPEHARSSGPSSSWDRIGSSDDAGGIAGGIRRTTNLQDGTISYGGGRLSTGSFDVTPEGQFGAGIELDSSSSIITGDGDDAVIEKSPPLARIRGAADGFGQIARDVPLGGEATFRNTSGTTVEFGRVFARPRGLPESCDFPIAIKSGEQRELRIETDSSSLRQVLQRPGLTVTITEATGSGNARTAHVVVGSYLTYGGMARFGLLDWTEQFDSAVTIDGCDGDPHTETGAPPPPASDDGATSSTAVARSFGTSDDG